MSAKARAQRVENSMMLPATFDDSINAVSVLPPTSAAASVNRATPMRTTTTTIAAAGDAGEANKPVMETKATAIAPTSSEARRFSYPTLFGTKPTAKQVKDWNAPKSPPPAATYQRTMHDEIWWKKSPANERSNIAGIESVEERRTKIKPSVEDFVLSKDMPSPESLPKYDPEQHRHWQQLKEKFTKKEKKHEKKGEEQKGFYGIVTTDSSTSPFSPTTDPPAAISSPATPSSGSPAVTSASSSYQHQPQQQPTGLFGRLKGFFRRNSLPTFTPRDGFGGSGTQA